MHQFLPLTVNEMNILKWKKPDFILITGDAYVDHPSFGAAVISRVLEDQGFKVAIIAQPDWRKDDDFRRFGEPNYAFLVTSGNIDSMVAHYTAAKRKRSEDNYSPGGKAGLRPDRAVTVYCNRIRQIFPEAAIIIGGIEASLRRFAHYDYWSDTVMPSVLIESKADLLCYGMAEKAITEVAQRLRTGEKINEIRNVKNSCYLSEEPLNLKNYVECASFENVKSDKVRYTEACRRQYDEQDPVTGKTVIQKHGKAILVQNPPALPLTRSEFDHVYELPYMRSYHPSYGSFGGVPAIEEVEFSIIHNRGCFGGCNFCALTMHQGRFVTSRSKDSILKEAKNFKASPRFNGYINDVGGPTANFRKPSCSGQYKIGMCKDRKCLTPSPCSKLVVDHREYGEILKDLRELDGVKKVFVRSGIRFDYLMLDQDDFFFKDLVKYHISGQLKVAPEHCSDFVLSLMGKPRFDTFVKFTDKFYKETKSKGLEQYLVPYLMSSHPGSTLKEAIKLALYLKENHIRPEQVQDFYPTPGTISTSMFYTEIDPFTMKKVYVPKSTLEKRMQRALLQYYKPENRDLVMKALLSAGRKDLIGYGKECLIKPIPGNEDGPVRQKSTNRRNKNERKVGQKEKNKKY